MNKGSFKLNIEAESEKVPCFLPYGVIVLAIIV